MNNHSFLSFRLQNYVFFCFQQKNIRIKLMIIRAFKEKGVYS